MRDDVTEPPDPSPLWLPVPLLLVFLGLPTLIELVLIAGDLGLIGVPRLRQTAYQYGAFWSGLLGNWRPNYAVQPELMFVTYSFLHASFWHLAGNMVALFILMQLNAPSLRGWTFAWLYMLSAVGGALGFALLGPELRPMVGSSGALFGLAGAWRWQEWMNEPTGRDRARVIARDVALLSALNAIMWLGQDGALAWEAHLGGFVAGAACMALLNRLRSGRPDAA